MKKIFLDKSFISLLVVFITGLIAGFIFTFVIDEKDKLMISKSIIEYIDLIKISDITHESFINSFIPSFILLNLIFIVSFLFIFVPTIYFINFYKGFTAGFTIGAFIISYKLKGLLYAFIFAFPHEIVLIVFTLLISTLMIKNTSKIISLYKNDKSIKIKAFYKKFVVLYIGCTTILLLISILELFINSYLIKLLF